MTRRPGRALRASLAASTVLVVCAATRAQELPSEPDDEDLFATAVQALEVGAPTRAVDTLELLSDRGFAHPDASFNRGLAYLRRGATARAKDGDLGRAAAAFMEASLLAGGDPEASHLHERVQEAIATAKLRRGAQPVRARPSLGRAVAGWSSEATWALLSMVGAALLTLGLGVRLWTRTTATQLTGTITALAGAVTMLLFASLAGLSSHYRQTSRPAVVVVPETRLLDERGTPLPASKGKLDDAIAPEGAFMYVLQRRGRLAEVEWGDRRAWLEAAALRQIATP